MSKSWIPQIYTVLCCCTSKTVQVSPVYKPCDISDHGGKLLQETFSFYLFTKRYIFIILAGLKKVPTGEQTPDGFLSFHTPTFPIFFQKPDQIA